MPTTTLRRKPLHGTFVIDPIGRILWQDIGAEPFDDPEFVVQEAKRLLQLHPVEQLINPLRRGDAQ